MGISHTSNKHTAGAVRCVWAAILVGFFAMLRKDNISSSKARTFDPSHRLIRGDLQYVQHTKAIWLRCRFGKTNQFNAHAHVVPLPYTGGILCHVTTYAAHMGDYPSTSEVHPAFMYGNNGYRVALLHTFLVKVLKQLQHAIGESPELFAYHSLRRGGPTLAFALGAQTSHVMILGDWASLVVLGYNDAHTDLLQCLPRLLEQAANACLPVGWSVTVVVVPFQGRVGVYAILTIDSMYCIPQSVGDLGVPYTQVQQRHVAVTGSMIDTS